MPGSSVAYIAKIKGFAALQPNWDTYQGLPPTEDAIQRALSIIRALDEDHMPCVCWPMPDSSIQMIWCTDAGDELCLFVLPDARLEYVYRDGHADPLYNDAWDIIDDIHAHTIPAICQAVH